MTLNGQIALVTGASRGIGRAIAIALSRAGALVVVNYRDNQTAAEESLSAIRAQGGQGELCPFDIADEGQIEEAVKKIVDGHGKVDIVVNNAGVTVDNLLMRTKPADWDQSQRYGSLHQGRDSLYDPPALRQDYQSVFGGGADRQRRTIALRRIEGGNRRVYQSDRTRSGVERRDSECRGSGVYRNRYDGAAAGKTAAGVYQRNSAWPARHLRRSC